MDSSGALEFCCTSPHAVVVTLWPSGYNCLARLSDYLEASGGKVLYSTDVLIEPHAAELVVRALYHGEDWLESNCWYSEQPLESGPPSGPHAGAKWKAALCFRSEPPFRMRVFVVDAEKASGLWSNKYSVRSAMSRESGNPGNSCMHLTDCQKDALTRGRQGARGLACDDSYAFHCARCLLTPESLHFLNEHCADPATAEAEFGAYAEWLATGQAPPW